MFEMIGNYENGWPHGPFWIGNAFQKNYTFLHFNQGNLIAQKAVLLNVGSNTGIMGNLVNGSILDQAQNTPINWFGEYKCLKGMHFCTHYSKHDLIESLIKEYFGHTYTICMLNKVKVS